MIILFDINHVEKELTRTKARKRKCYMKYVFCKLSLDLVI